MSPGIAQLVAVGPQDVHLVGKPEISFFRSHFKRHTNFSLFTQTQTIQGKPAANGMSVVKFERLGDLLNYVTLTATFNGESNLIADWSNVIDSAELLIGGQVIDTQDSIFTQEIAIDTLATTYSKSFPASLAGGLGSQSFFYPFRFFFCEHWLSSLPLVALQYHDVELRIHWSSNFDSNLKCDIKATYVSLDDEERQYLVSKPLDMLIFQVQKSIPSNDKVHELVFNHPIRFIASSNAAGDNNLVSRVNKVKLEVNGEDMTDFDISVPNFTSIPSYYHTQYSSGNNENMFMYPFCLDTAKFQPSGSLNFSRVDSFKIHCTENINKTIYAVNHNILRIQNGLGGLLYSN